MSKLIKNNEFIRTKMDKCIDMLQDSNNTDTLFEEAINDEYLSVEILQRLKNVWNEHNTDNKLFIHELLASTELYLPELKPMIRNPELEKRIQSIKAQLDEENYRKMVYNVDLNSSLRFEGDKKLKSGSFVPEFKTMQGQVIAVINSFACIVAAFFFGYKAIQYSLEKPDINKQMMGGFLLALVVAIADFYFLFKKLLRIDNSFEKNKKKLSSVKSSKTTVKKSKLDKKND